MFPASEWSDAFDPREEPMLLAESYEGRIWTRIEQTGASKYVVRASTVYLDGTWRDTVREQFTTYEQAAVRYSQLLAR